MRICYDSCTWVVSWLGRIFVNLFKKITIEHLTCGCCIYIHYTCKHNSWEHKWWQIKYDLIVKEKVNWVINRSNTHSSDFSTLIQILFVIDSALWSQSFKCWWYIGSHCPCWIPALFLYSILLLCIATVFPNLSL